MSGFLTQRSGCLANDLQQTLHCRLERGILAKSLKATPGELLNEKSRLEDVTQPKLVGATHNGIASDRMSWSRSFSAPVETTSTGEPKSASRSSLTWRRSKSELDASNSTKKSMSLPGRSSPRATDPKTETARPRWRRTTDRISSRRERTSASRDREPTSAMRLCYPAQLHRRSCCRTADIPLTDGVTRVRQIAGTIVDLQLTGVRSRWETAGTVIPMETTIDSVGRIVVPKQLRDSLGMQPGTIVDVSAYGAGLQVLPAGRTARIVQVEGRTVVESDTPVTDDIVFGLIDSLRR